MLLGAVADDFTGATDLAGMLVKHGMRTVQMIDVPSEAAPEDVDAVVVALKTRNIAPESAVAQSVAALRWLERAGARQFFFKYCSTFDSTPRGNIGPVAEAMLAALAADFSIACPSFPANGRTVYKGHLFVGDRLLSESGMSKHPLTPMTESDLVRVLQQQARGRVGLVDHVTVVRGAEGVARRFAELRSEGVNLAIVDALSEDDLDSIGAACAGLKLVTGGSAVAGTLPRNFLRSGLLQQRSAADSLREAGGARAVIAGSCSEATQAQVAAMRAHGPSFRVDPIALDEGRDVVGDAVAWAAPLMTRAPVLIYATADAASVRSVQARLGAERAGTLVERALSDIARSLVDRGVGRLIVAGGETAGAVVHSLGIKGLRIGREIDSGVPWTFAFGGEGGCRPLALALKSGNFGTPDFFLKAWDALG